ncbi:MAG: virulence RhuM family protein, partial [Bacteroidales bacterium]|nr:virulence RhuM family protein [Bacteroidales bacterium]
GYRVKSQRGIDFRKWANKVLKEYLLRGYAINQRIERLEQRVSKTEEKIVAERGEVDEIVKNLYTDCKKSLQFLEIFKS